MANQREPFHITVTVIWDAHALNRDEKAGGNVLSIKKLHKNGKTVSFIGKPALRHYLWETLRRAEGWEPAPVKKDGDVIQFDIANANIMQYPELDLFGYMYTISGEKSLIRKAPLGITKAVAIEDYAGDMAFYANHDLARRLGADPNPYSKEEHFSCFMASFTFDTAKLGDDRWIIKFELKGYDNKNALPVNDGFGDVESLKTHRQITDDLRKWLIEWVKKAAPEFKNKIDNLLAEGRRDWSFRTLENPSSSSSSNKKSQEEKKKKWTFSGAVELRHTPTDNYDKSKRILAVLCALHNGLVAQSSGELNTLVPILFLALPVRVPVPVAHSLIRAEVDKNGIVRVRGIKDVLRNGWVVREVPAYLYFADSRVNIDELQELKFGNKEIEVAKTKEKEKEIKAKLYRGTGWEDFENNVWKQWWEDRLKQSQENCPEEQDNLSSQNPQ